MHVRMAARRWPRESCSYSKATGHYDMGMAWRCTKSRALHDQQEAVNQGTTVLDHDSLYVQFRYEEVLAVQEESSYLVQSWPLLELRVAAQAPRQIHAFLVAPARSRMLT